MNTERPDFNSGLLFMKDEDLVNSNVGVFYEAPGWKHKDFYSFLLL